MTGSRPALVLAAALALTAPAALAGTSPTGKLSIVASLSPDQVAPGQAALLTVQVSYEGLALPDVALPSIPGVAVDRAETQQNFSMVNGKVTRASTTVLRLVPRAEGTVTIPPLTVAVGSDRATTDPMPLTVTRSAAPRAPAAIAPGLPPGSAPSGTPEIFVKATADRTRAYWNQQVTLRLRLYSRVDVLGDVDWKPPSANGFWTESLGPPRQGRVRVNGTEYAVMEIPTALFPTRTGTLTVGPARIRCRVARVVRSADPWSLLAMPDVVPEDVQLDTDPVTITVDPLPGNAPAGFDGAVGDFKLAFRVDARSARAGEPVTARAVVTGTGNVPSLRDPEIRARGASRDYEVGTSTKLDRANDRISGEREHDVAFVADQPGTLEILPVRFVWFDPEARSYRWQVSEAVPVTVVADTTGGAPAGGTPPASGAALAAPRSGAGPSGTLSLDPPASAAALFGASALLLGAGALQGRARRRRERDPRWSRLRALEPLVDRALRGAEALARTGEPAKAAAAAEEALRKAAGFRYDVEIGGMARPERDRALRARGAGDAEVVELERLFEALDAIAYAPPETRRADAREAIAAARRAMERYRKELQS